MMKASSIFMAAGFALALAAPAFGQQIAITGGTVHTMTGNGVMENGTILVEDGKILAVGQNFPVPPGYDVVDATGKWVTPGLMNAVTRLGLQEVMMVSATSDHGALGAPFSAAFDVSYGLNPNSSPIAVTRIEGITRAAVIPSAVSYRPTSNGNHSVFGGLGALIHLGGGDDILVRPRAVMYAELGEAGAVKAGGARGAAWVTLITALKEARDFDANRQAYQRGWREDALTPRLDVEALVPVVAGEIPLMARVERASDLRQVIALKESFPQLRFIVLGGKEAWMVAEDLAAANIPVILNPFDNLPASFEGLAATSNNAARLHEAGVLFAIAGGSSGMVEVSNARLIPQTAGNAVAHGLPWQAALEALTINPARIFGIADRYGSIAPGMEADVVVWDGDPLEVMSSPETVMIRGEIVPLTSRQTKLRDRYRTLDAGERPFMYR